MKITDTIAAISSAAGNSGIGIIRVSGDEAIEVVDKIFRPANKNKKLANVESHTVHYGHIMDGDKTLEPGSCYCNEKSTFLYRRRYS